RRIAGSFDPAPNRDNRNSERTRSIASFHWRQRAGIFCSDDERDRRNARAGIVHMNRCSRSWECVLAGVGLSLLALDGSAVAADIPIKAPHIQAVFDWTGLYIGTHAGYSRGASSAVRSDPASLAASNTFSGVIGGVQAGYNVRLPSGLLFGVEADITFPN